MAQLVIDVVIPDLGSDEGADLVELLVPVGGQVEEGDSLVLLESDKASMEVPAPAAGTVTEWLIETGTTVKEGAVIARLAIDGALRALHSVRWWLKCGASPKPQARAKRHEENCASRLR